MASKSLKIFVTGDSPRSLKKITLFNWSGFAFLGTRTHKKQLEQRQELSGTDMNRPMKEQLLLKNLKNMQMLGLQLSY